MSNEITKFYQFLSIQGQDWTKVADKEYGNSDGSLIKAEFKDYMNAEWNGEEMGLTLTDDLINKFWRKIDTNTSTDVIKGTNSIRNYNALDDKEVENLGKRIEAYQQFNEYVDMTVQSPGVFTSSDAEWRTAVIDELMIHLEDWINNGFQGDMAEYLEQFRTNIENKYTAEFCASEYQNELLQSVLKDYPDYKVGDDSTLTDLLENYVKNLESMEGTVDPETIKSDVRAIIDAYFATAGLGEGSGYDLSQVGYEPKEGDKLNDIQKEVLSAKLRENLADITSDENYEEFKALYDAAINAYIEETVSATKFGDFESVMNMGLEEFKETDAYKKLMVRIEASSIIGELEEGNDFYNAIVDTLGQSLADDLVIDHKFIGSAYDDIINEALNKCQNGEFMTEDGKIDKEALLEYVTTELAINLNSIYQNGYSDMPLKELNNLYDKLYDTAMNIADNEPETANTMIRDAAISYCDALVQKGGSLKNAVIEIFGEDYKAFLNDNNNRISTIVEKMNELKEAVLEIGDASTYTIASWTGIEGSYRMTTGTSMEISPEAQIMNGTTPIETSRITYSASIISGNATISGDTPPFTITSGESEGQLTVQVCAMVDGIQVGEPFTVKITVKEASLEDATWRSGDSTSNIEAYGIPNAGGQITNYSFQDLYNYDAKIRLHIKMDKAKRNNNWETERQTVINRLTELGNYIKNALIDAGFDGNILASVIPNVVSNYTSTCDSHTNNKGTSENDLTNNCISYMNGIDCHNKIVNVVDKDWRDSNVYMISFRAFVDDIIAAYNAAVNK